MEGEGREWSLHRSRPSLDVWPTAGQKEAVARTVELDRNNVKESRPARRDQGRTLSFKRFSSSMPKSNQMRVPNGQLLATVFTVASSAALPSAAFPLQQHAPTPSGQPIWGCVREPDTARLVATQCIIGAGFSARSLG